LKQYLLLLLLTISASTTQAAIVNLFDGYTGVYDPADTYVATGEIGSEYYSFQLDFIDPTYAFDVTVTAPNDLVGNLYYSVTSGLDDTGIVYFADGLLAGESANFEMGGFDTLAEGTSLSQALSLIAPDVISVYTLGFDSIVSDFGFMDDGTGGSGTGGIGNDVSAVPLPGAVWLFGSVIAGYLGLSGRRKKKTAEMLCAPNVSSK
jgi:hypothetical protein